jgi:hypothetical protein
MIPKNWDAEPEYNLMSIAEVEADRLKQKPVSPPPETPPRITSEDCAPRSTPLPRLREQALAWLKKRQAEGIGPFTDSDVDFLADEFAAFQASLAASLGELSQDGIRFDAETNCYVARHTILTAGRNTDEAANALASAVKLTAEHWPIKTVSPPPETPPQENRMTPQERISWPPFTHGRIVCRCGAVVAQCKCPKGCEVVGTVERCEKCKDPNEQQHEVQWVMDRLDQLAADIDEIYTNAQQLQAAVAVPPPATELCVNCRECVRCRTIHARLLEDWRDQDLALQDIYGATGHDGYINGPSSPSSCWKKAKSPCAFKKLRALPPHPPMIHLRHDG